MKRTMFSIVKHLCGDSRGTVAILSAVSMVGLIGVTGLSVDVGMLLNRQAQLQASTDAAALAGALNVNQGSGGTAVSVATTYSAVQGNYNASPNFSVTMSTGYPVLKCLTSTGVTCVGADSANAIEVRQQATVPTYFAKIFGIGSWNISATSLASAAGGSNLPTDAVIILDSTQSMNDKVTCTGVGSTTAEKCALAGVRALLQAFSPCSATLSSCGKVTSGNVANPTDRVSLYTFPGVTSSTVADDYNCSGKSPTIASYKNSPTYQIVPFSSDYKSSDTATSLSTSSNIVNAAAGGTSSKCGITAVGGVGTYYADAITAAQSYLAGDGFTTTQVNKVMIILTDGAANASSSDMPSGKASNQCQQGITAAQAATAAGTTVYTVSYGSSTATGSSSTCTTDSSGVSACSTMQQMASAPKDFFSDTTAGEGGGSCTSSANPSFTGLLSIFKAITTSVGRVRLLPLNTT